MQERRVEESSTTEGLPVAPTMGPTLEAAHLPIRSALIDRRVVVICGVAAVLGVLAALAAQLLLVLIALITGLVFRGELTLEYLPPAGTLGSWVAWAFGEEPSVQIADDLRRLKQLLETGEIPTTKGQSSGRGVDGRVPGDTRVPVTGGPNQGRRTCPPCVCPASERSTS